MNGRARLATVALAVIAAVVAGGCSGDGAGGDKAGGAGEPVVLRMANTASNLEYFPAITDFVGGWRSVLAATSASRSSTSGASFAADAEQQVVRAVATGQVDLGHAGTRIFDTMGVTSFQALQAPMLIDSYALQRAVIEGDIPGEMLQGLDRVGVAGLGVLGGGLSKPIAVKQPLLGLGGLAWDHLRHLQVGAPGPGDPIARRHTDGGLREARDQALQDGKLQAFELYLLAYQLNTW